MGKARYAERKDMPINRARALCRRSIELKKSASECVQRSRSIMRQSKALEEEWKASVAKKTSKTRSAGP